MKPKTPRTISLTDYCPPDYLVDKVDLHFSLEPAKASVRSRLSVRRNPHSVRTAQPLVLDGEFLQLAELQINGKRLRNADFEVGESNLSIRRVPAEPFTLEASTTINPEANTALQGLYRSKSIYCTQCEAEGFRRITYMIDRPDVLAAYTVRIDADITVAPVLLSNGNLIERGTMPKGRHYAIWHDPHPKPSYLFALVAGDLGAIASDFTTKSGSRVDLRIYVEHGKEQRAAWAMDALKRAMRWDETAFGREYDLERFNIVAVSDFNMGAMENKGLNIFNDRLILASPETATDANFEAIESVVAHEYFHNWTGNRITCRDWFQLCLKEGLTVYRDQEFSSDERTRTVQRISDVRQLKATQFPEDAGPLAHPVRPSRYMEINNFYTATVYEKGAELVRMIATMQGPQRFRTGMDLYFERHDGQAVTIEDFLACFETAEGELTQFKRWYVQAGTPELICRFSYDRANRMGTLTLSQTQRATPGDEGGPKLPLPIPLRLGLIGPDGKDMPLQLQSGEDVPDGVVLVTGRSETFRFVNLPVRPVPSLLRGFSAPVNLTIDLTDANLAFLASHDSDLFNRWQAANVYATRLLLQIYNALVQGKRSSRGASYGRAIRAALADRKLQPAYKAELLRLPTPADLAREVGRDVDPALVHRAHKLFSKRVAIELGPELEDLYASQSSRKPYDPDAASTGRRALRNAVLSLLTSRATPKDIDRLRAHYFSARNMTDQAHALNLLAHLAVPARDEALAHFLDRWKGDDLVIDLWFGAQALSSLPGTLATVRTLTRHPNFKLTTPNKVRALIGSFAMGNLLQFNRPDGEGYTFVGDQVLVLDGINPQMASRVLSSFRSWRSLEPVRRGLARKTLIKIGKTAELSRDVHEIVSKMLDA
jgi:aminopeptidase N